ncbi:MAG TPA: hypothetical protein VL133_13565, partial [Devosia sp.]|nr:hypothetical protein [Devosia sp.]
ARAVTGLGIGGYTSTQVAARMNAHPILVSVAGDAIPASGSVAVTAKTTNVLQNTGVFTGAETGTLADVPGTMSTDAEGNWTFTRARPGGARYCPAGSQFVTDWGALLRHRIAWLWGGRNGALAGHGVEEDIAVAVASLGHDRYLVGSVLTAASDNAGRISEFQALNLSLKTTYGSRFVDVYDALRAAVDGSPEDAADVAAGLTPRSKRSDAIHLNAVGYALVASCFQMATIGHGW